MAMVYFLNRWSEHERIRQIRNSSGIIRIPIPYKSEFVRWLESDEATGQVFAFIDAGNEDIFAFTDPATAMMFKLRFG